MTDRQILQQIKGEIEAYLGRAELQRTPYAEVSVEDLGNWHHDLASVIAILRQREEAGYKAPYNHKPLAEQEAALQALADQAQQLDMGYRHD